jgi:hypothetical protein
VSRIFVRGWGSVSPAGWGVEALRHECAAGRPLPVKPLVRPGWERPLRGRVVPPPPSRPEPLSHARLRRSSPISQFAVSAAWEAMGGKHAPGATSAIGIVLCVMSGCVNYSRRFYDEVLKDPAVASPLVFPETVFNAPSSHLAALLESTAINYTLVGDPGTFLVGLALAAQWIGEGLVDDCLVVGAEEHDWLTADAFRLFTREMVVCEGAGALRLSREPGPLPVELAAVTDAQIFWDGSSRAAAAHEVARQLAATGNSQWLCDSCQGVRRCDEAEAVAWKDWKGTRVSPKTILGEGLMAAAAWQCVLAADAVGREVTPEAWVSVVGCNEQAVGGVFRGTGHE